MESSAKRPVDLTCHPARITTPPTSQCALALYAIWDDRRATRRISMSKVGHTDDTHYRD